MRARLLMTLVLVLLMSLIAACSGGDDDRSDADNDTGGGESAAMDMGDDEAASSEAPAAAMEESAGSDRAESDSTAAQIDMDGFQRRVIRNGELELVVSDVNSSVRHARAVAEDYGGFVESSSTRLLEEEDESANLTIDVPSGDFDEVMSVLRDGPFVTRVEREMSDSRDVTEEFVDLQSRLRNLESTEARFLALLDEANTIEDVMSVERELSRIRGEIEEIQGRLNYLEERTDNSRINVAFYPDSEEQVAIAGQHFTPGETAREAWNASMEFVGAIGNAVIAVAVFFWWGWPLLAIGALVYLQYRRRRGDTSATPSAS